MSSHRVMRDLFRAFEVIGPGLGKDPGNGGTISPTMWGQQFLLKTTSVQTRTLARPSSAGILVSVVLETDGGDCLMTVTGGYNAAGDTSILFQNAGDMVVFISVKVGTNYEWLLVGNQGTTAKYSKIQAISAPGPVTVDGSIDIVTVNDSVNGAITLAAPSNAMRGRILTIEYIGAGTNATTLALTNVQGGSAATTATFNAAGETLVLIGGASKWNVLKEVGVTLS